MVDKFVQSEKTRRNIAKRYGINKDAIQVIDWNDEGENGISWEDKVEIFLNYPPYDDILSGNYHTYYLGEFGSHGSKEPMWVELTEDYVMEYFYWLIHERMNRDGDYLDKVKSFTEQVAVERARKRLEDKAHELAREKYLTLPEGDERTFDDIKTQVIEALEE